MSWRCKCCSADFETGELIDVLRVRCGPAPTGEPAEWEDEPLYICRKCMCKLREFIQKLKKGC